VAGAGTFTEQNAGGADTVPTNPIEATSLEAEHTKRAGKSGRTWWSQADDHEFQPYSM
jgi:hypothetical protein